MVYSVRAGAEYELLQENNLNEVVMSTPAIAENYLFFRTNKHLVAVSLNNSQIFLFRSQTTSNKGNAQFPILKIAMAIPAS